VKVEFLLIFLAYIALLLLVSLIFSKRMKDIVDFFLASRKLPGSLVYLTLCASWFGATSILVSADQAYETGLSSFWIMGAPAMLTVLFLALFLVRPIRSLTIVSLPDLVEMRYGRAVRHLASLLVIWYMAVLAASQMVAVGHFLKSFLGMSYFKSLALGTAVVLIYSIFGGLRSVVMADSVQFFFIVAGLFSLLLFLSGLSSLKEVSLLSSAIGKGHYLNFFFDFKKNILIVLSFTLAWTISPIAWQRIQAARSERDARGALYASSATFFLLYGTVVLCGMLSLPLFVSRKLANPLFSEIISSSSGFFLRGVLFVGVVAAIMSTMDTAVNTGALSLTRDVFEQLFPSSREKGAILASRLSTFLVGGTAFLVATKFQSILKTLGLASEIMAEGLFIPGMAMIFLKRRLPLAGLLSLVFGGGFSLIGFLSEMKVLQLSWIPWPYSVPYGLGLSFLGFFAGLALEKWRKKREKFNV